MRILIAPDSFKDALPATDVCQALARGVQAAMPHAHIVCCPLADGGEGTAEVLTGHLKLTTVKIQTCDPLRRPLTASYLLGADGHTAFVEMARTAGLQLLTPQERNPLLTTTFGTGMQMADAAQRGVQKLVLAIGGSATNDAGTGMAAALGWRFLDKNGVSLAPIGANLSAIERIVSPAQPFPASIQVICDVTNPLFGPNGAAHTYARQKGASDDAIEQLDAGLRHFAAVAAQHGYDFAPDLPGSGAAGGMGYGTRLFLGAELRPGADTVMDLLDFDQKLAWADAVLTGEGAIDGQTANGKLIHQLCRRAKHHGIPVLAFCGKLEADAAQIAKTGLRAAFGINDDAAPGTPLHTLLPRTAEQLERTARRVFDEKNLVQDLLRRH
ncbi:MAG: glycerate kinase [Saprospiraceae bacterium]|nr:glycerate kinase [Saprospiraceae bacterium]